MFSFFESLQSVIKADYTRTDNEVFRLHCKVTLIICVAASLLVSAREYFGDPIDCIPTGEEHLQPIVDTYCWIHSTFTLPDSIAKDVGTEVAHPGVEQYSGDKRRVFHKYYQWVCFVLFFQGVCFYIPRYIWKQWEGGRVKSLLQNLRNPVMKSEEKRNEISLLANYLTCCLRNNDMYFTQFVFCEVMNLVNVICQIYFVDMFLGGEFSTFGLDVLRHTEMNPEDRSDPMIRVFPRMTKCTFHFFGSSGDVQKHDTLCILPLNVLNEKIYIFLWFWFWFLTLATSISLIYRAATIAFPVLRFYVTSKRARMTDRYLLKYVIDEIKISDWFILHQLSKNMDPLNFRELLAELGRHIKSDRNGNGKPLLRPNIETCIDSHRDASVA